MALRVPIRACPLCDGAARTPWQRAHGFELVRCAGCGHRYSAEVLAPEALATDYYGEADADLRARVTTEKRARLAEYRALLGGWPGEMAARSALDVGCNAGELLLLLKELGYAVAGVEVSAAAAAVASARLGVSVVPSLEALPAGARFDLITLTHVLEHVAAPRALLQALRARLVPAGRLLIEVPCADDPLLALFGGAYRPLCPGDHASFFDAAGLRRLLTHSGLEVLALAAPTHARDLVYPALLSSLDLVRARLRPPADPAHEAASGVTAQVRYRGWLRRPLRRLLDGACALLDPLVVRATAQQAAALRGPVLVAVARAATDHG